jgi:hypothetical protein
MQTCNNDNMGWDTCNETEKPVESQSCGNCGTQTRTLTCTKSTATWSGIWGSCQEITKPLSFAESPIYGVNFYRNSSTNCLYKCDNFICPLGTGWQCESTSHIVGANQLVAEMMTNKYENFGNKPTSTCPDSRDQVWSNQNTSQEKELAERICNMQTAAVFGRTAMNTNSFLEYNINWYGTCSIYFHFTQSNYLWGCYHLKVSCSNTCQDYNIAY